MRAPSVLIAVFAFALFSGPVFAADVTLKDAIQCKDFKHNGDGSWFAEDVSVSYGPGKSQQMNLFGRTTIRKGQIFGGTDLWALLNEKCGS